MIVKVGGLLNYNEPVSLSEIRDRNKKHKKKEEVKNLSFIKLPREMLEDLRLTTSDIMVFLAISSFYGKRFPSYTKIESISRFRRAWVSKSIKNLENFGYLMVDRSGYKNIYTTKYDV